MNQEAIVDTEKRAEEMLARIERYKLAVADLCEGYEFSITGDLSTILVYLPFDVNEVYGLLSDLGENWEVVDRYCGDDESMLGKYGYITRDIRHKQYKILITCYLMPDIGLPECCRLERYTVEVDRVRVVCDD